MRPSQLDNSDFSTKVSSSFLLSTVLIFDSTPSIVSIPRDINRAIFFVEPFLE